MSDVLDVRGVQETAIRIRENVQRVIVGKDNVIDLAVIALLCRGHILVEDVPGIGKTTMAKALAQSLGCSFKRIQFTPDIMPADVLGVNFFNQKAGDFEFRPGPIFSEVVLVDEINRATPRTQSALLEAMQERQATIDGTTMSLPDPFLVMATQNPIEMEGTFPLPEAQLDRFMVRVILGYPSAEEESDILLRFERDTVLSDLESVIDGDELKLMQGVVPTVRVDKALREYIVAIVNKTREHSSISLGASPRAGLFLYKASQARAAIDGRDFVTPDDIKENAVPVLAHRLILTSNARVLGHSAVRFVGEALDSVTVPIER